MGYCIFDCVYNYVVGNSKLLKRLNIYDKMKNLLSTLSAIILSILFVSCSKDCKEPTGINGEWIWTKSVGYFGTYTPLDLGFNKKLIIDDFIFKQFENDSLIFESQYDLVIREANTFIDFEHGLGYIIDIQGSKLELSEYLWTDGYTHYYIRK